MDIYVKVHINIIWQVAQDLSYCVNLHGIVFVEELFIQQNGFSTSIIF